MAFTPINNIGNDKQMFLVEPGDGHLAKGALVRVRFDGNCTLNRDGVLDLIQQLQGVVGQSPRPRTDYDNQRSAFA